MHSVPARRVRVAVAVLAGSVLCTTAMAERTSFSLKPTESTFTTASYQAADSTGTTEEYVGSTDNFLTGMEGFEDFVKPVGMPFYFEDPFIDSDVRLVGVWHALPEGRGGGEIWVAAAQLRIALTDRLSFIATKDGYSWLNAGVAEGDGWNDVAIGLKYNFYQNEDDQYLISGGLRWEFPIGEAEALQGGDSHEFSPFVAIAKGWDDFKLLATINGRIPTDSTEGLYGLTWHLHLDYKMTETFRPLVELHGIHWLSNGKGPLSGTDYLDVGSLGSRDIDGNDFFSIGAGFRWEVTENVSLGATYELPLEDQDDDLQEQRVTVNTVISF